MSGTIISVAETHPACSVLGPGVRFVVWVQGCSIGCHECISPQWIPAPGGTRILVAALADRVVREARDGLTLSGGEPFDQAEGLADLIEAVRAERDLSTMSYSGYTLEHLRRHGTPGQRRLLGLLDILVDGPFLAHRLADRRWRGSANQHLHLLTDRHRDLIDSDDVSVGLQIEVGVDNSVQWMGVPTVPRFRERFETALGLTSRSSPPTKEHL
jgi:anaerobic ribonucleoside-triphosphate reductase activating protein